MTLERIAELQELCANATEGPWEVALLTEFTCSADADFIAAARTALPELLAEVARLTRERDESFNEGIEAAEKAAQRYEPFGPPDDDFCNKRPDEGEIAQLMWSRTQLTVEAIRALKKPATDEAAGKSGE